MQIFCDIAVLFGKWSSHVNFIHTLPMPMLRMVLYQSIKFKVYANVWPIPQLLTFCVTQSDNYLHLSVNTYVEIQLLITCRNISFKAIIFSSRPLSSAIIKVSTQCLDVCRQCLEVST